MYEEDEILEEEPKPVGEPCPRCLVPVPLKAERCPLCGLPVAHSRRIAPIAAGIACVLALVFLFVMMYRTVSLTELEEAPPVDDIDTPAGKFAPPPETSAGHEPPPPAKGEEKPADIEPEKKPPLNR
jgi:hypothetical protein